ncbi:hypothetical protein GC176_22265 [bacterium]|nr:hypothetical protein [bacterium]
MSIPQGTSDDIRTPENHSAHAALLVVAAVVTIISIVSLHRLERFDRFIWLAGQVWSGMIWAWPISLPIECVAAVSFFLVYTDERLQFRPLLWLLPGVLVPLLQLVWGAVFKHTVMETFEPWHLYGLHLLLSLNFLLAIVAVVKNRGQRVFVSAVVSLLLLWSLFCGFISGMSVTGDWI